MTGIFARTSQRLRVVKTATALCSAIFLLPAGPLMAQVRSIEMLLPAMDKALANPVAAVITGRWPSACVPASGQSVIDGQDIVLIAQHSNQECEPVATEFKLEIGLDFTASGRLHDHYRVHFFVESPDDGRLRMHGFRLLSAAEIDHRITPESGWWWPRSDSPFGNSGTGTSFSMEMQNGSLVVSTNVYGPDGQPVWYLSAGKRQGNIFEQAVYGFAGGQTLFGPYQQPGDSAQIAHLSVELHSAGTATLWFSAPLDGSADGEIALTPISVVRHSFAPGDYSRALLGHWLAILPDQQGEQRPIDLHLSELNRNGSGDFQYMDESGLILMECRFNARSPNRPPSQCMVFDQFGKQLGVFDDIGLTTMASSLKAMHAFKLDK